MSQSDLVAHLRSVQQSIPVQWDASTRLCLDGQRYVPILRTKASTHVGLLAPEALLALKVDQQEQDEPIFEFARDERGLIWAVIFASALIAISHQDRTAALDQVARRLRDAGVLGLDKRWHGEYATVYDDEGPVLDVNRALCRPFGMPILYPNVTAYSIRADGTMICYVGQRSLTKYPHPGLLDSTAGGGLAAGERPLEGAIRELEEEAGIPATFSRSRLVPTGLCSIVNLVFNGIASGSTINYELDTEGIVPTPNDGEVATFVEMTPREIIDAILAERFMAGASFVWLNFLHKRGYLDDRDDKDEVISLIRNPAIAIPAL